jgi:hypothetical protein
VHFPPPASRFAARGRRRMYADITPDMVTAVRRNAEMAREPTWASWCSVSASNCRRVLNIDGIRQRLEKVIEREREHR